MAPYVANSTQPTREHAVNTCDGITSTASPVTALSARGAPLAPRGDQAGIEQLLTEIRPAVLRYCQGRLRALHDPPSDAEDVTQEVLFAVYRALPGYRDTERPFLAFVFGIAARKVADAYRSAAHSRMAAESMPERADVHGGPEEHALRTEDALSVRALLDRLLPQQRDVLVLRVGAGLSAQEAGEVLAISPGAVRVIQHRALARLRSFATEDCPKSSATM